MGTRIHALGAVAVIALVTAGCGGGAKAAGVATLSGHTSTTAAATADRTSSANNRQAFQDAMLNYTRCMRDHGVDMPDPTFDSAGDGNTGFKVAVGAAGPGNLKDNPAFNAAQKACQPILDKVQQDMPRPSPEEQAKMRDDALAMARCMRAHGIDMPDPTFDANGGVSVQIKKPATGSTPTTGAATAGGGVVVNPTDDPKFKAAMEVCAPKGKGGQAGFTTSAAG
jgi:hypothetical protein